jgi:protease-4
LFNFLKIIFSPIIAILDFITKYFKTIVFLTIMYFLLVDSNESLTETSNFANLQKIELSGPIMDVSKTLEEIEKAKLDKNIKGILISCKLSRRSSCPFR